jgi:hypothetical protein
MNATVISRIDVMETCDYDDFNIIKENREIDNTNVTKIMETVNINDGIFTPIAVDKNYEVIDGQHRLEACRRLEIPVKFIIVNKTNGNKIVKDINSASKKWCKDDYVKYNSIHNNSETYQEVIRMMKDYNTSSSVVCTILGLTHRQVEGSMEAKAEALSKADELMAQFTEIYSLMRNNLKGQRMLAKSIKKLNNIDNFSYDKLIMCIRKNMFDVLGTNSITSDESTMNALVAIYNRGSRSHNRIGGE